MTAPEPWPPALTHNGLGNEPPGQGVLAERLLHSALCTEADLHAVAVTVDAARQGTWGLPWELHGLSRHDGGTTTTLLAPAGSGDPAHTLVGRYAPPDMFGLVCVHEAWARSPSDADTNLDASIVTIVLADGRHHTRIRIRGGQLGQHAPTDVDRRLRAALTRMVGMDVPAPDPHHGLVHVLKALAVNIADRYRSTEERLSMLRRSDPLVVHGHRPPATQGPDWLHDTALAAVTVDAARAVLIGCADQLLDMTDSSARWWGDNGRCWELLAALGRPAELDESLSESDPDFAVVVRAVVAHRLGIWQTPPRAR